MKLSRSAVGLVILFWLVAMGCSQLRAQGQSEDSSSAKKASSSSKIKGLQKELDSLKSQIDQLKKAQEKKKTTPVAAVSEPPPAPASKPTLAQTLFNSTNISGSVDGYYSYDFNHPADRQAGLRVFDNYTNQFSLNLAEVVINRTPDPSTSRLGYNLTFGYGNAINVVNGSEPVVGASFDRNVEQAYMSYLAPIGKGLEIDFGKFVTPVGAEVIESAPNWNYSRGLLFGYAIPFYHFGLRAGYTFSPKVSLTGYLVNGWNDIVAPNTGKTYGFSLAWTPSSKVSVTQNYLGGPQELNTNKHWRNLTNTVVLFNVTRKLALMENFDWGGGDVMPGVTNSVYWTGIASYAKYDFNKLYDFAVRYEYYNDHYGFTTGTPQHINEYTLTLQRNFAHNLITRLEFRRDMSNAAVFPRGTAFSKNQDTLELGMMYVFNIHGAR